MAKPEIERLADGILREYPDRSPAYLADELEKAIGVFDQGPDVAREVVEHLRRCASLGVRVMGRTARTRVPPPANDDR